MKLGPDIFSERQLTFVNAVARPYVCLYATSVHRTQPIEIFGNVSTHLVPRPPVDIHGKFYGDRPRGVKCTLKQI